VCSSEVFRHGVELELCDAERPPNSVTKNMKCRRLDLGDIWPVWPGKKVTTFQNVYVGEEIVDTYCPYGLLHSIYET
jgi:hypothetical protein